jgi:hypothetical protein
MYIKEGLVYNKITGELTGFCNIGCINQHLISLKKQFKDEPIQKMNNLASTMMVFIVRGLFNNFTFPYASFPAFNLTGDQLVPHFFEALMRVERCGLQVVGITLDGSSVNRKFVKIIGTKPSTNSIKHYTLNPLSFNKIKILFFSDPPHLIKTTRNCLANPQRHMEVINNNIIKIYYYYI